MSQVTEVSLELIDILADRFKDVEGDIGVKRNLFLDHLTAQILGKAQSRSIFNTPAILNEEVFTLGDELKPLLLSSLWRAQIQVDTAAKVRLNTKVEGVKQTAGVLNDVALAAGIPKSFDFQANKGFTYNFELDTTAIIEHLYLDEIPINA